MFWRVSSNPTRGVDICLSWGLCIVRYRSLRRSDHSSRGVLPTVVRSFVWYRKSQEWGRHDPRWVAEPQKMFLRKCKITFEYLSNEVAIEAIQTKMVWRSFVLVPKYPCHFWRVCYLTKLSFVKIICHDWYLNVWVYSTSGMLIPRGENRSIRRKICLKVTLLSPTWTGLYTKRHYQPNKGPTSKQPWPSRFSS